jgi:hypothetical protein
MSSTAAVMTCFKKLKDMLCYSFGIIKPLFTQHDMKEEEKEETYLLVKHI